MMFMRRIKLAEMYIKYPEYEIDSPLSWLKKARENPKIDDKQLEIVEFIFIKHRFR